MNTLFTKLGEIRRVSVIGIVDNHITMSKAIILNSKLWFAGVALLIIEYLYSHLATLRFNFEYDTISSAV